MTTLDVALRVRLQNMLGAGANAARQDLQRLTDTAKKLDGAKAERLARDLAKTKTEAKGAEAGLQKVAAGARKLEGARAERLARDLGKVRGEATSGERAVYRLGQSAQRLDGAGAERLARGLRQAASAAKDAGHAVEQLKHKAPAHGGGAGAAEGGAGALIMGAGRYIPLVGGAYGAKRVVGAGLGTAIEQEKAWAEVEKKVEGTPEQKAALQKQLRALALKYGLSIPEAFNQAAEAGAANVPIDKIPDFMVDSVKGSVGWDMDARRTAEVMAKLKVSKQWSQERLRTWMNKVNMIGDKGVVTERDLVEMFFRSASSGASAGFSEDDMLALLGGTASTSMPPEMASRFFGAYSSKLAGAHAGSDAQIEGWEMLGLDPDKIADGMVKDAWGTMEKVAAAFKAAPQKTKIAAGSKIFGEGWWDENASFVDAIPESKRLRDLLRNPANYEGSLDAGLNIQLATTANHLDRLSTLAQEVGDRMSRWALPPINEGIERLIGYFERLKAGEATAERRARGDLTPEERAVPLLGDAAGIERRKKELRLRDLNTDITRTEGDLRSTPEGMSATAAAHRRRLDALKAEAEAIKRELDPGSGPGAATQRSMEGVTSAIRSEGERALGEAKSIADRLRAMFDFHASPTISPRFGAPAGAATGDGAATPRAQSFRGGAPAAAPAREARAGRGGVTIGAVHVHGVTDLASFEREITRRFDREVLDARDGALHDTGGYA